MLSLQVRRPGEEMPPDKEKMGKNAGSRDFTGFPWLLAPGVFRPAFELLC